MDNKNLKALVGRGLSILRFDSDGWKAIEETRRGGTRFSLTFPHEIARTGRPQSLVLITAAGTLRGLRIGLIQSVQTISTFDSRVVFDLIQPVVPDTFEALLEQVTETPLRAAVRKAVNDQANFRAISPKLSGRLINLIAAVPNNAPALQRILSRLERPKSYENARAMEQDAVGLALKAFGLVDGATEVALPGGDTALGAVRLQEDAVIEHDARWIPGWHMAESDLTGRALFTRQNDQLEVFTANKRPLEELFGVDLIYLNQIRKALVMVQYKMMERGERKRYRIRTAMFQDVEAEEQEWSVPIDAQFKDELGRMAKFDKDLDPNGSYRLNSGPFFFKLVRRHASTNASGIMLSLGHLNQLIAEGTAFGPKGGLRINYRSLDGHYLRSDPFVELVRSGYIGTRGATTGHLEELINAALNGGRAVVAAIHSAIERAEALVPSIEQ